MIQVSDKVQGTNSGTVQVSSIITTVLPATIPAGASLYATIAAFVIADSGSSYPSIQTSVSRNSRFYTQVASAYGTDDLVGESTYPMTYVVRVLKLDAPDAGSHNTVASVNSSSHPDGPGWISCQQFMIYNHDDTNVDTDYISGSGTTADLDAPIETYWGAVSFGGFMASEGTWSPLPTVTHGVSSADTSTKIKETYGGLFMIRGALPGDGYLGAQGSWSNGDYIGAYYAINSKGIQSRMDA